MPTTLESHVSSGACATHKRNRLCTAVQVAVVWIVAGSCADADPERAGSEWRAQVDTVGDTIVVGTLSGSQWGEVELIAELRIGAVEGADHEIFGDVIGLTVDAADNIYVYDRQVPALRKYAADGKYLTTFGREGGGPGEYANSDGGLAVLSDGRVVLRDPGNGRFTVFAPDGEYLASWTSRGGAYTSTPIVPARDGGFYSPVFGPGEPMRLVRFGRDGQPGDSLPTPERQVEPQTISAQDGGSSQRWAVPFSERSTWTWHPDGHYVTANTGQLAITLLRGEADVLRIEMDVEPIPVSSEERAAQQDRAMRAMRRMDPAWTWNGPPIPRTKPIIRALYPAEDGRLWVQLYQPGERVRDDVSPDAAADEPVVPRFREPVVFEVFEKDGRYLGRVVTPPGFSTSPRPVFRGTVLWAMERDDLDVQYIVKYRLAVPADPTR